MTGCLCGPSFFKRELQNIDKHLSHRSFRFRRRKIEHLRLLHKSCNGLRRAEMTPVLHPKQTLRPTSINTSRTPIGGYGFITSDEGERFLDLVSQKQRQGDSTLITLWLGKGDSATRSIRTRGFTTTSMSA